MATMEFELEAKVSPKRGTVGFVINVKDLSAAIEAFKEDNEDAEPTGIVLTLPSGLDTLGYPLSVS